MCILTPYVSSIYISQVWSKKAQLTGQPRRWRPPKRYRCTAKGKTNLPWDQKYSENSARLHFLLPKNNKWTTVTPLHVLVIVAFLLIIEVQSILYQAVILGNGQVTASVNTGCTENTSNTIKATFFYVTLDNLVFSLCTPESAHKIAYLVNKLQR